MKTLFPASALLASTIGRIGLVGCLLAASCSSDKSSGDAAAGSAGASTAGSGGSAAGSGNNGGSSGMTTSAGSAGMTSSGGSAASATDSVLERNNHASRDGHFMRPALTLDAIPNFSTDTGFAASFTGNMWASPVFLESSGEHKGLFFAVTTSNDVIALDETSGALVWKTNLGDSPTKNGVNCGSIHPLGILGTPVIDAATRTIYVAGAIGTTSIAKHEIHALGVDDGKERAGFPIDVTGMTSGTQTFAPPPQNQRSALSLVNGKLYVAYGGHVGDCGPYHGWVVAIDTTDPTKHGAWASLGQGEGIWAAGGMASDGTSVFAVTGNSTVGASDRSNSDSEQLVRLSGLAELTRNEQNLYFPTTWKTMDDADADFGSSNPIYLTIPGSTPANYVAAVAKDGHLYLLNATNLGGMGGQTMDFTVSTGAMSVHTSPASYSTSKGVHFVLSTDSGSVCPSGSADGGGQAVVSVLFSAGSPPTAKVEWCAPLAGEVTAPVATTTDGTSNAAVWFVSAGKLMAVDGDTGKSLYTSSDSCADVRRWTSPIAVKNRVVVGGDNHLCSWSVH
jgi:hypothetical protein